MERRDSTGFYVVDALSLKQASRRPRHLESRMRARNSPDSQSQEHVPSSVLANRQAIIDARRAKLANKLTHIKDAVTTTRQRQTKDLTRKKSLINKSLKVAERNREKILQDQVRQCAESNTKAQQVALQQRQLSEERRLARHMALEERLRAHERRRQKFLTLPKKAFLQDVSRQHSAASTIQKWLRTAALRVVVKPLGEAKLTLENVRSMPFQKTMYMLQDKGLITKTARFISYLNKASGKNIIRANSANLARVFLSSFFMVCHTKEVFPDMTPQESALLDSATRMLTVFTELQDTFEPELPASPSDSINTAAADVVHDSIRDFWRAFRLYHTSFEAWKINDTDKMISGMIEHYLQLEKMRNLVGTERPAREEFEPKIKAQQEDVKAQLARIAGPQALARLEEALQEYKQSLMATSSEDDGAMSMDENTSSPSAASAASTGRSSHGSVTRTKGPSLDHLEQDARFSAETMSKGSEDLQRVLSSLGSSVSNLELAHEIIMDPEFTISTERLVGAQHLQVQGIARKAFFDQIGERMKESDYASWLPNLLEEVRKGLLALLPSTTTSKMAYMINESLDSELILQQADRGILDPSNHINFILDVINKLCAPARDPTVREIRAKEDLTEKLRGIMELIEAMKLDLANYHLSILRPFLKVHAKEYEMEKFDAAENEGSVTLNNTRKWLARGFASLQKVSGTSGERRPDYVVIESYLETLFATHIQDLEQPTAPETLLLDARRLFDLQNQLQAVTIVAALLMLTRNFSSQLRSSDMAIDKLKKELFVLLADSNGIGLDNLVVQVSAAIGSGLSDEQKAMVDKMVRKTLSYEDTVYKVLVERTRSAIRSILRGNAQEVDYSRVGLEAVRPDIEKIAVKVAGLVQFNSSVHARRYNKIVSELYN